MSYDIETAVADQLTDSMEPDDVSEDVADDPVALKIKRSD